MEVWSVQACGWCWTLAGHREEGRNGRRRLEEIGSVEAEGVNTGYGGPRNEERWKVVWRLEWMAEGVDDGCGGSGDGKN